MYKQIKYEFMARATLRIVALGTVILLNAGMALIFGGLGVLGTAGQVLSVVLSSVALAALIFIGLFNDLDSIQRLLMAPAAYLVLMTPVKPWKLLGSRTLINFVQDVLFIAVGVLGVILQVGMSTGFPDFHPTPAWPYWYEGLIYGIMFLFDYYFLILTIYFAVALTRTVLAGIRGRTALAVLAAFACAYLHNAVNVVLYPFVNGAMERFGPILSFTLDFSAGTGGILAIVLAALKCAALFFGICKLMERKLNV